MNHEETILVCAVRYGLGRMSYIVDTICEYVDENKKKLTKECINVLIRDIKEELERYHIAGSYLGMECDEKRWKRLLEVLEKEVENESTN